MTLRPKPPQEGGRPRSNSPGGPPPSDKVKVPLSFSHPELAEEWHPDKNGPLTPQDVREGNGRTVWWRCSKGPAYEWPAVVSSRAREWLPGVRPAVTLLSVFAMPRRMSRKNSAPGE